MEELFHEPTVYRLSMCNLDDTVLGYADNPATIRL